MRLQSHGGRWGAASIANELAHSAERFRCPQVATAPEAALMKERDASFKGSKITGFAREVLPNWLKFKHQRASVPPDFRAGQAGLAGQSTIKAPWSLRLMHVSAPCPGP